MPDPARSYRHITEAIYGRPWALQPRMLGVIEEIVHLRAVGSPLTDDEIETRIAAASNGPRRGAQRAQGVAVLPVYGVISQRMTLMTAMSGGTSVEGLTRAFREAMADPDIGALVLDVDSPGGSVEGITELATEIRAARGGDKPIVAVANAVMASAAYWLASQADEVVASPSAQVGSIGVYGHHLETSRADDAAGETWTLISAGEGKEVNSSHVPLSDAGKAELQAMADSYYSLFVTDVAAGRGVPKAKVTGDWKAQTLAAKAAKAAGLVDRVDTLDATVRRLVGKVNRAGISAAAGTFDPGAETPAERIAAAMTEMPIHEQAALWTAERDRILAHYDERERLRAKVGRPLSAQIEEQRAALESLDIPSDQEPDLVTDDSEEADTPQAVTAAGAPFEILEAATRGGYALPPREVPIS